MNHKSYLNSFEYILLSKSSPSPPGGNQVDGLPPASSLNFYKKRTFGDFGGQIFQVCDILNIQNCWDSFLILVYGILIWIYKGRAPDL